MNKAQAKAQLAALYVEQSQVARQVADLEHIVNPRRRSIAKCGTDSGYYRHVRTLGEKPCLACRNAHADYERAATKRRAAAKTAA